jgi:hypothetical protein
VTKELHHEIAGGTEAVRDEPVEQPGPPSVDELGPGRSPVRQPCAPHEEILRSRVDDYARARGIDPGAARAMIDRGRLVIDDQGVPLNVRQLVDELLEAHPYLAGSYSLRGTETKSTAQSLTELRVSRPPRISRAQLEAPSRRAARIH